MKKERIVYALGQVEEQYIMEAAPGGESTRKKYVFRWRPVAACLAALVVLMVSAAAAGLLDPLLEYVQGDEDFALEEILAPVSSVSNETVELRLEGAIADKDACYMVVSLKGLTKGEQRRLENADLWGEVEVYGLLENGDRVMGASTTAGTYMQGGWTRSAKSFFPDAAQTRVIVYEPKFCEVRDVQTVCFAYDGLVLEFEPEEYMSPERSLTAERDGGTLTKVCVSRVGFSFVQELGEGMSPEDLVYDIHLIAADGTVLSEEEMREIGTAYSVTFSAGAEETKITGNWGRIPAITILDLDDYCGLRINGEDYYDAGL